MNKTRLAMLAHSKASLSRSAIAIGFLAMLLVAAAALWPGITGPFVFDDFPNLQNLQEIDGHIDVPHLRRYVAAFAGNPGRPLSGLSFAIEDFAWPTEPQPFKRDNILFHLLAGILVFALVRQLGRLHPRLSARADLLALATTAAWLLHPIQLSTMMLVVQRMTILSSIFMLAGVIAYIGSLRLRLAPLPRVVLAGGALAGFGLLALLCKENGVLVFAYATALNLTLLRPQIQDLPPGARRLLVWGTAAPIAMLVLAAAIRLPEIATSYGIRDFTLSERLLTEPRILIDYLRQILLPRIGGEGIFHDDYPISHGWFDPASTLFAVMILAVGLVAAWRFRVRAPLFAFAVFWFLSGHLIESTVVPLELYFEHRNYLAMLGPLFALVALIMHAPMAYRVWAWAAFTLWLGMATALTTYNARIWGDRDALAQVWYEESPGSVRTIQFMASAQFDRGEIGAARRTLEQGLALRPEAQELAFQEALIDCFTTGLAPATIAELQASAAHLHYARVIPDVVTALRKQALGERCNGTFTEDEFKRLVQALMSNPAYSRDTDAMGYFHYELGKLALQQLDLDLLMHHLDKSYELRPNPSVPREQAIYLLSAGLPDAALRYLELSDSSPQPLLKRWLLDIPALNKPLRQSAIQMRRSLQQAPGKRSASRPPAEASSDARVPMP